MFGLIISISSLTNYPPAPVSEAMIIMPTTVSEYQQPTEEENLIPDDQLVSPYSLNSVVKENTNIYVPNQYEKNMYDQYITGFSDTVTVTPTSTPSPKEDAVIESLSIDEAEVVDESEPIPIGENIAGFNGDDSALIPDTRESVTDFTAETDINSYSNLTEDDINKLIEDYPNLNGIADDIFYVENEHGINAIFVLAVASLESGYGETRIARDKNNLFGLGAYDETPYQSAITFDSRGESVRYFGDLISDHYIKYGRTSASEIGRKYCSSDSWARKIVTMMNIYSDKLDGKN